jgi:hypothetical protein
LEEGEVMRDCSRGGERDAYYDMKMTMIGTDTFFEETMEDTPLCVVDEKSSKQFGLYGVSWLKRPVTAKDLEAMADEYFQSNLPPVNEYFQSNLPPVTMELSDNGNDGDGIRLSFLMTMADAATLLEISLTPQQAAVLGESLLAVVRLRRAQEGKTDV